MTFILKVWRWWFGTKYERIASWIILTGLAVFSISTMDLIFHIFAKMNIPLTIKPFVAVLGITTVFIGAVTLTLGKYFDRFPSRTWQMDKQKIQKLIQFYPHSDHEHFTNRLHGRSLNKEDKPPLYDLETYLENPHNQVVDEILKDKMNDFKVSFTSLAKFYWDYFFHPDTPQGLHPVARFKYPMRDGSNRTYEEYLALDRELTSFIDSYDEAYLAVTSRAIELGHL